MQKRISKRSLIAVSGALIWLATVSTTAHALLGSDAQLTGNHIIVGSAGLLISNSQAASSTTYEHSREGFTFNLAPGQSAEKFFLLKNTSSADIAMGINVAAIVGEDGANMAPSLRLEFVAVDATGVPLENVSPVGRTLSNMAVPIPIGGSISKGSYQRYKLTATLDAGYNVPVQDLSYDLLFTGTQLAG